ncbi:arsenical resistance operon transcriptional repressor ArsD [Rhodohalobacter sp. SW132]|uniref:arsenite efflux transporter metallochaperone ArsD n=1 Tax=Rhodohalobacter sp. SW132 TaxID=2293433 RepID=UPI000E23F771|nr:arsenite efflux transporter metallochaperone ArsD [Rhodohalobacter sp. SW132]REL24537.1 arsenical resistance operon transcriptional repressor ArsD [Rhodohalobacter sp. SW132]
MNNKTAVSTRIDIYDPAMCCSTGVCGPDVDDSLTDFANDVKWMKVQGIEVNRFNLGQEPEAFKSNPEVLTRLKSSGSDILPIIFVNGEMVSEGGYPDRQQLMEWLSDSPKQSQNGAAQSSPGTDQILNNLEAAVTDGNEIQVRAIFHQGESSGVSIQEMVQAMQAGINNRQRITESTLQTAHELLGVQGSGCTPGGGCC